MKHKTKCKHDLHTYVCVDGSYAPDVTITDGVEETTHIEKHVCTKCGAAKLHKWISFRVINDNSIDWSSVDNNMFGNTPIDNQDPADYWKTKSEKSPWEENNQ